MKRGLILTCFMAVMCLNTGCVLTKIVTVPMRVVSAVVSIVPVAGNTAHDSIDKAAEFVDDLPF